MIKHCVINNELAVYSINHALYRVHIDTLSTIVDLLNFALQHELDTVWICPGSRFSHFTSAAAPTELWDIQVSTIRNSVSGLPPIVKGVTARLRSGSWEEKRQITITWPEYTPYRWAAPLDPVTILGAIRYVETALQVQFQTSPGLIGRELLKKTNTGRRENWLEIPKYDLSLLPADLGYDLAYNPGHLAALADSPLFETEDTGLVLIGKDKNSTHTAAAGSVELGVGTPVHMTSTHIVEDSSIIYDFYDGKRPGLWRIEYLPEDLPLEGLLYNGQQWVTTPLLRTLLAERVPLEIKEFYCWPEHHRIFDRVSPLLWDARQSFKLHRELWPREEARKLAYEIMKKIMSSTVGMLNNPTAQRVAPQFFRPDWRVTIVEESKVKIFYKMAQVRRELDLFPLLVATDEVIYLLDKNDLARFHALFDESSAERLGGWKTTFEIPFTRELAKCFDYRFSAGKVKSELKKVMGEGATSGR